MNGDGIIRTRIENNDIVNRRKKTTKSHSSVSNCKHLFVNTFTSIFNLRNGITTFPISMYLFLRHLSAVLRWNKREQTNNNKRAKPLNKCVWIDRLRSILFKQKCTPFDRRRKKKRVKNGIGNRITHFTCGAEMHSKNVLYHSTACLMFDIMSFCRSTIICLLFPSSLLLLACYIANLISVVVVVVVVDFLQCFCFSATEWNNEQNNNNSDDDDNNDTIAINNVEAKVQCQR